MYRRIVAVVDGSRSDERVLSHARVLAEQFGAELNLLRVTGSEDAERREADRDLSELHARLAALGLTVHYRRAEGPPGEVILEQARHQGADLLALAAEAEGADAVVRGAPCPLLLLPAGQASDLVR